MKVEPYSENYRDDIVELVRLFYVDSLREYLGEFQPSIINEEINSVLLNKENIDNFFLLIEDGQCQGVVYGIIYSCKLNSNRIFQETFLYVKKEYRRFSILFFREIEKRLKARGIKFIIMTVLENYQAEPLKRFYIKRGFKPLERHFIRNL